jgi:hypothetical protein
MAAALLVGGVTACSDLTGTTRADGTYFLQGVNNSSLPFSYIDNNTGRTFTVQNDTYVLASDGSYSDQQSYTDNGSQRLYTESGSWSQSNNVVTFTPFQSSTGNTTVYQATLGNSSSFGGARTMTINFSGTVWYYSE